MWEWLLSDTGITFIKIAAGFIPGAVAALVAGKKLVVSNLMLDGVIEGIEVFKENRHSPDTPDQLLNDIQRNTFPVRDKLLKRVKKVTGTMPKSLSWKA